MVTNKDIPNINSTKFRQIFKQYFWAILKATVAEAPVGI